MTQELRVQTGKGDVGGAVAELARHADEESLSLRTAARISSGEWVRFIVELEDDTKVLEGIGRCLGCERNGGAFYALLDQLQFDERNEIVWERILLERESQTGKGPITGLVELDAIEERAEKRSRSSPPPLPSRSKPPPPPELRAASAKPPAPAKPAPSVKPPASTRSAASVKPPAPAKPLAREKRDTRATRSKPPPASRPAPSKPAPAAAKPTPSKPPSAAARPAPSKPSPAEAKPAAWKRPASERDTSSTAKPPAPERDTSSTEPPPADIDPTITRVVRDPQAAARLTEHLHEATREIHIDRTDLPIPHDLAVRAAVLVPRLERALGHEPTTHKVLLTAMRLGLSALEAQTDPETWSDHDD